MAALRWGLVSLGLIAFVALRFCDDLLDDWLALRRLGGDWPLLADRMSQLKPPFWKAGHAGAWLVLFAAGLGAAILALFVLGVRDVLRPRREDEDDGPTAPP